MQQQCVSDTVCVLQLFPDVSRINMLEYFNVACTAWSLTVYLAIHVGWHNCQTAVDEMISAVAPSLCNPSEVVVRGTAYKLKATNGPSADLISLLLLHTYTRMLNLCFTVWRCSRWPVVVWILSDYSWMFFGHRFVLKQILLHVLSVLRCWARSPGCQDLSHILRVTQSFLSAVCLCLRGASHELSNEVLTITFLSRCCLWFYGKRETCMLKYHMWRWVHTESFACGSSSSNIWVI